MSFTNARTIDEAIQAMANGARPIAGGSDLVVSARQGGASLPESLVAIDRISELQQIEATADGLRIGACVTHASLMTNASTLAAATAIADAAALVGSPATRNVGTIGGNVMNASPAMDTGAPLVVLDAHVVLRSIRGDRSVPVGQLWTGPGQTVAEDDELCIAVGLPVPRERSGSAYVRLEYRRAMEIAVVGAAASVDLNQDGSVADASLALTAVGPTILSADLGALVSGRAIDDAVLADVAALGSATASPISDLRAGDEYRRHMVGVMAKRAVAAAAGRAVGPGEDVPVNRSLSIGASL